MSRLQNLTFKVYFENLFQNTILKIDTQFIVFVKNLLKTRLIL